MSKKKETPEDVREKLRQKELKNNPIGTFSDGLNRAGGNSSLADSAGGLGWKGTSILIVVLIVGYALFNVIF